VKARESPGRNTGMLSGLAEMMLGKPRHGLPTELGEQCLKKKQKKKNRSYSVGHGLEETGQRERTSSAK